MSDVPTEAVLFLILFICLFVLYMFLQWKIANDQRNQYLILTQNNQTILTTQQEDIYNISSRVQQGQGQWPTTNTGQVPLDNFTISSETNKHNDDPPTYEEAMRLAMAASTDPANNVVPVVVPPVIPPATIVPKPTD